MAIDENSVKENCDTSTPKQSKQQQVSIPWSFIVAGLGTLAILAFAIITPELLDFSIRQQQLQKLTIIQQAPNSAISGQQPMQEPPTSPTIDSTSPIQQPTPSTHLRPSVHSSQSEGLSTSLSPVTILSDTERTSKIFDAYGRLLTLLVAMISIMGVFFGYFVRRTIREVEEDVEKRLTKSLDGWEKERNDIKGDYAKSKEQLESGIIKVSELEQKADNLQKLMDKRLTLLDEAIKRYQEPPVTTKPDIQRAIEELDKDLQAPQPVEVTQVRDDAEEQYKAVDNAEVEDE